MYSLILISIPPYLTNFVLEIEKKHSATVGPPRGFGVLGRMAIYFQGAGEQW